MSTLNVFCSLNYLCHEITGDNASMLLTLNNVKNYEKYDPQLHQQIFKFIAL